MRPNRIVRIVIIGSFGAQGDPVYRVHQPATALAGLPDVQVIEVHPAAAARDAAALAADLLVLTMTLDLEALRLIRQRRLLGRPTVVEVNDYLPDVQPWNPAASTWQDRRGHQLFHALIRAADGCQFSSEGLAERLAHQARAAAVFPNHLNAIPPERLRPLEPGPGPLRIGWGGSAGHRDDLASIAPALISWLQQHPEVQLELMADAPLAEPFQALPAHQFRLRSPSSLADYLAWLPTLDIGLAPLLPTAYNACRSDVKFLEYGAAGVVPVLQNHGPYRALAEQGLAPAFETPEQLVSLLEQLLVDAEDRRCCARTAERYVREQRRLDDHIEERLQFYRRLVSACPAPQEPVHPWLEQQRQRDLEHLPGLQQIAESHWRLDLSSEADQSREAGIAALQQGNHAAAEEAFRRALAADPSDHSSLGFLGLLLRQRGEQRQALEAFRSAHALNPLALRPRRGLEHPFLPALQRGQALAQQGDREAAVAIYRGILQRHPTHRGALFQLAAVLNDQNRTQLARACVDRLLRAHPDHSRGYGLLADLRQAAGDPSGAAAALACAQALDLR